MIHAIAFTASETAELVTREDAGELGPAQVRGRSIVTLMSPGTELSGSYTGEHFPFYPGYAAVFEAEETGAEVTGIAPGQLLFCMGKHQSMQQTEAAATVPVPENLPPEQAVLARLMGVSMTALATTRARPGDKVLVTGLGPVGHLAAHISRRCGYQVMASDPIESRRAALDGSGIEPVWEKIPAEDPAVADQPALVIECSGHEQAVTDACRVVMKGGEVVMVGVPWRRQTDIMAHEILNLVFHRYIYLRSGWEWELPRHPGPFQPRSIFGNYRAALRWLAEGSIPVEDHLQLAPPADAQAAYQDNLHKRNTALFTLFDWRRL